MEGQQQPPFVSYLATWRGIIIDRGKQKSRHNIVTADFAKMTKMKG